MPQREQRIGTDGYKTASALSRLNYESYYDLPAGAMLDVDPYENWLYRQKTGVQVASGGDVPMDALVGNGEQFGGSIVIEDLVLGEGAQPVSIQLPSTIPLDQQVTSEDGGFQTMGPAAVSLYEGLVRKDYHKSAGAMSDGAVRRIDELIRSGADVAEIEAVSREAFESRQELRATTQEKLTPLGKAVSKKLETPHTFDGMVEKYAGRLKVPGSGHENTEVLREIASASGRSKPLANNIAAGSRALGVVGTLYGAYEMYDAVSSAPEEQKGRVFSQQSGSVVGGGVGAVAGGAAVMLLVSNPVGWTAIAVGGIASFGLGYAGSKAGGSVGDKIYDFIKRR